MSSASAYLLSPGAAYITGACVRIDGGASLNPNAFGSIGASRSEAFRGFHRAVEPAILRDC
jgi:citronellol/citronellal dehydrogenase